MQKTTECLSLARWATPRIMNGCVLTVFKTEFKGSRACQRSALNLCCFSSLWDGCRILSPYVLLAVGKAQEVDTAGLKENSMMKFNQVASYLGQHFTCGHLKSWAWFKCPNVCMELFSWVERVCALESGTSVRILVLSVASPWPQSNYITSLSLTLLIYIIKIIYSS